MNDIGEKIRTNGDTLPGKKLAAVLLPTVLCSFGLIVLAGWFGQGIMDVGLLLRSALVVVLITVLPASIIFYLFMRNQGRREAKLFLALSAEEERYRLAFESSRDIIFDYDYEQDLMLAYGSLSDFDSENRHQEQRFENFLDLAIAGGILHHDDIQKVIDFKNGTQSEPFDIRFRREADKTFRWIRVEGTIVYDHARPARMIGKLRDIEEEKQHERELLENSRKDGVTDFFTWETGKKIIEEKLSFDDGHHALLFFKILNMQQIDENSGAIFANAVIVRIAEVLKSCTRDVDMLIRLNRGAFIGILPDIGEDGMLMMQTGMERQIEHMYSGAEEFGGLDYIIRFFHTPEELMNAVSQESSTESDISSRGIAGARSDTVSFAFNILEHAQDFSSAMRMLLEYMGTQFNIMAIHVNEILDIPGMEQCLYDWVSGPAVIGFRQGQRRKSDPAELERIYRTTCENDYLILNEETLADYREETRRLILSSHTSHLLVPIVSASKAVGLIDYEHLNPEYNWPESTIATAIAVTRVVSTYIMKDKSESSSRAKSDFLSSMSHEIRTPMNAIAGFSELILSEPSLSGTARKYAADIKSAADSLLAIVNDILDFSKIESGKFEIIPGDYRLSSLLHDVCAVIQVRLSEKEVAFQVELENDIPDGLFGDMDRVKQILLNLLANAAKFTEKGSITLRLSWEKKAVDRGILHAAVKDTGIGIRQEDMGKLFESFSQVDMVRNKSIKGTGLGLVITRNLLRLMGGEIGVESEYGVGSEFYFHLPQMVSDHTPCIFDPDNYSASDQDTFRVPFTAPEARVMIVDDNRVNLAVAKGLIGQYGVQIDLAASGEEALELYHKNRDYDIIFMDHMMPQMDGIETTTHLRHMEKEEGKLPVVALTANAIKGMDKMFLDAGMNDYLSKPLSQKRLLEVMERWIPEKKKQKVQDSRKASGASAEQSASPAGMKPLFADEFSGLEGIDTQAGLSNCVGDKEVYRQLLKTFVEENAYASAARFYQEGDWENYKISVHGLKSSANYIGAMSLSAFAKKLEDLAKEEKIDEIRALHPGLEPLYRTVSDSISACMTEKKEEESKPKEQIPLETLVALIMDLLNRLENMEFSEAEQIMEALDGKMTENDEINTLIDELRVKINGFDYDEAQEKAEKIKSLLT